MVNLLSRVFKVSNAAGLFAERMILCKVFPLDANNFAAEGDSFQLLLAGAIFSNKLRESKVLLELSRMMACCASMLRTRDKDFSNGACEAII